MSVTPRTRFMIVCGCLLAICGLILAVVTDEMFPRVLASLQALAGVAIAVASYLEDRRRTDRRTGTQQGQ